MVSDLEDISSFDEKYVTKIDKIISGHNCQVEKTSFPHFDMYPESWTHIYELG